MKKTPVLHASIKQAIIYAQNNQGMFTKEEAGQLEGLANILKEFDIKTVGELIKLILK